MGCECSKLNKKKSILYMIMTLMYKDISLENTKNDCRYPKKFFLLKTVYGIYDIKILTYIYPKDIHIYTRKPPGKNIVFNVDDAEELNRGKIEEFKLNEVRSHYQRLIRVYVYRYDNHVFKNKIIRKLTNVKDGMFDIQVFYNDDEKISGVSDKFCFL
jgi:hypothetical protein